MSQDVNGSCLCGAISYRVSGPLREVINCHCNQCRKASGHHVAATCCQQSDLEISGDMLKWYRSSPHAERGFCGQCGSPLFWHQEGSDTMSIHAGSIDGATGLHTSLQIHTGTKGDYYDLPANIPIRE